jgi:hypothetical protein
MEYMEIREYMEFGEIGEYMKFGRWSGTGPSEGGCCLPAVARGLSPLGKAHTHCNFLALTLL